MKLKFNSIKIQSIFQPEFQSLSSNGYNVIEFKKQPHAAGGIAVVYAPNGTGKSSLTAVLGNEETRDDLSFEAVYNDNCVIQPETKAFHTIGDQISRNVIEGETSDYLIGQDIRREYDLKKKIADGFEKAFNELNVEYKNDYKTTKVSDYLLAAMQVRNLEAYTFVRDIVNKQSKGKNIDRGQFLTYVRDVQKQPRLEVVNSEKKEFVISNVKIVERFTQIDLVQIVANAEVQKIEQSDDAINILGKYKHLHNCIVCDNDHIDGDLLLQRKKERRKRIYESLDARTKALLKDVAMDSKLGVSDPFEIKKTVLSFIASGEMEAISSLADTLIQTLIYYHTRMKVEYELVSIFNIPHPEGQVLLLTDIIQKAFRPAAGATQEQKEKLRNHRVFFTSRKTLLNEFNHFEGNMNIFQPAIDITETALQKEVTDIENKLIQLRAEYATVH